VAELTGVVLEAGAEEIADFSLGSFRDFFLKIPTANLL